MSRPVTARPAVAVPLPAGHDCAGCTARLVGDRIACVGCLARLPRNLRHALRQGERVRHRDHHPYLDALAAARAHWAANPITE